MVGRAGGRVPPRAEGGRALDEIIRIEGLSKTFPGTRALIDVDLDVRKGEVHALVGHNGSGKSTLIKVLAGYHAPDPGATVDLDGEPVTFGEVAHGRHGSDTRLNFVHQDLGLVLELDAIDNLALHGGFTRTRFGRVHWREQRRRARQLMAPFDRAQGRRAAALLLTLRHDAAAREDGYRA